MAEFRKEHAKVLKGLMPEQEKIPFTEGGIVNVLTNKDHKNRRVLIVNNGQVWDPAVVSSDSMFRMFYLSKSLSHCLSLFLIGLCLLVHIMAQLEKSTQICGTIVIYDFEGLGMKQIKAMTPGTIQRLLTFIQDAMPLRLKEVHFVKQPFIFNMVWSLMKPFLNQKSKSRVSNETISHDMKIPMNCIFLDALPW